MAQTRTRALIYLNRVLGPAIIQDEPLYEHWFYTIYYKHTESHYLLPSPLSRVVFIRVQTLFLAIMVLERKFNIIN